MRAPTHAVRRLLPPLRLRVAAVPALCALLVVDPFGAHAASVSRPLRALYDALLVALSAAAMRAPRRGAASPVAGIASAPGVADALPADGARAASFSAAPTAVDTEGRASRQRPDQESVATRALAQQLHDDLGHALAIARLRLDGASARLDPAHRAAAAPLLERLGRDLDEVHDALRRALRPLRPPGLQAQGLVAALRAEVASLTTLAELGPRIELQIAPPVAHGRYEAAVETVVHGVAREALTNALRHAQARVVRIVLEGDAARLVLTVHDDGVGVAPADLLGREGRYGIAGMRDRAAAIGATISLKASRPGTCVRLVWEGVA